MGLVANANYLHFQSLLHIYALFLLLEKPRPARPTARRISVAGSGTDAFTRSWGCKELLNPVPVLASAKPLIKVTGSVVNGKFESNP
jgi:hypothetical protein